MVHKLIPLWLLFLCALSAEDIWYKAKVNLLLQSKVKGEEEKVKRVPGLSLSQDWTTTTVWQDAIMSCFLFFHFLEPYS